MSGHILNPFSADFNPTSSVTYSTNGIPILAYGLIGITSLTLAYVTLLEKSSGESGGISSPSVSATSMLPFNMPSISPTAPAASTATPSPSVTPTPTPSPPKIGGKSRRHHKKHHKNTKRKK